MFDRNFVLNGQGSDAFARHLSGECGSAQLVRVFLHMRARRMLRTQPVPLRIDRRSHGRRDRFGLSWFSIVRKIILPGALPAILPGFRISAAIAIVLLVAAEMIGAEFGIGAYILLAGSLMATDELIAGIAILSVLGLSVSWLIARAERFLLRWRL